KVHCPCIEGRVTFNPASPLNEVQQTSGHPPRKFRFPIPHVIAALCIGGAAVGWVFSRLGIPLPWMLGPLLLTAVLAVTHGSLKVPVALRWSGQMTIASVVALNLSPVALIALVENGVPMLASALGVIILSGGLAIALARGSNVNLATALFATLPGGPVEMAGLAQRHQGQPSLVAFAQTLRIGAIVLLVPPLLIVLGTPFKDVTAVAVGFDPVGLALLAGLALGGAAALYSLRSANAFFIGPLITVGCASALGFQLSPIPGPIIALGQIFLGTSLGAMFDRALIKSSRSFLRISIAVSGLLVAFGFVLAGIFWNILDQPFAMLALANAPGSVAEMAITAEGMSLNVAIVTGYHLVRIFIIVPFAESIFHVVQRASKLVR
ncbi:AbrB family transcriptional regulator, partial [Aurantimonas sp. C2-5-R2]